MDRQSWFLKFRRRKSDYTDIFNTPQGQRVLADLRRFCKGDRTTFHKDPAIAAFQAGKQEVFFRIVNFMNLTEEQIAALREDL